MSKQTIHENIIKQAEIEKNNIISSALGEAEKYQKELLERAKLDIEKIIAKEKDNNNLLIASKENEYNLIKRQQYDKAKRQVLDKLEEAVFMAIQKLSDHKLLDLVASLIDKEEVTGKEIICVSRANYFKYLQALCSKKGEQLTSTDILNRKLSHDKYNFQLSSEPVEIANGFILIAQDYDLNFDFKILIERAINNLEKKLSELLFE